jgi:hypothetical protein
MDEETGCTVNHAPPSYEEAIKYPSISSLLSTSDAASPLSVTVYDNSGLILDETNSSSPTRQGETCATLQTTSVKTQGNSSQEDVRANDIRRHHYTSFTRITRSLSCSDLENIESSLSASQPVSHLQHRIQESRDFPHESSSLEDVSPATNSASVTTMTCRVSNSAS